MLIYRGALVYAEDRNHDERSGMTPPELEVLKFVHGAETTEAALAAKDKLPRDLHDTITVSPIVNNGRWVVPCPWCFSASAASRDDHRFFCVECRNRTANGKWIRVVWPESKDEIETLLVMRPDPRTRNWGPRIDPRTGKVLAPPETLSDLVVENEHHGVL